MGARTESELEAERVLTAVVGVNPRAVHKHLATQPMALDSLRQVMNNAAATSIQARVRALPHMRSFHRHRQSSRSTESGAADADDEG